jgi:hypothetical protein
MLVSGSIGMTTTDKNELSRREASHTTSPARDFDSIEEKLLAEEPHLEPMRENYAVNVNSLEIGMSNQVWFPIMGKSHDHGSVVDPGIRFTDAYKAMQFPTVYTED